MPVTSAENCKESQRKILQGIMKIWRWSKLSKKPLKKLQFAMPGRYQLLQYATIKFALPK